LKESGVVPKILFLEADDAAIVRRQESARRPLPLQGDDTLLAGVRRERERLASLRSVADMVVDTSKMDVHQLARRVLDLVSESGDLLKLTVMSFGHKNGVPVDADVVLDVRFLPNPHWVPELRPQNGLSAAVSDYVLGQDDAEPYLRSAAELVRLSIPGFQRESKQHLTVALGCTGGKHRSVAMAVALAARLSDTVSVKVFHRDLGLE
jgi:UPF0042 nucleotide-binding protein